MPTMTNGTKTPLPTAPARDRYIAPEPSSDEGMGWILFAGVMFMLLGTLNVIWGIAAVAESSFFVANASYLIITDLATWGWIAIGFGALELLAAFSIWAGGGFGRWFGILVAGFGVVSALLTMPAYPLWSLTAIALGILVVYGLAVHGGKPTTIA
jgi:hypothetical protein